MAPLGKHITSVHLRAILELVRRRGGNDGGPGGDNVPTWLYRDISASPRSAAGGSAGIASSAPLFLGLGLGIGGAIILAIIIVVGLTVKKRSEHLRMIQTTEVEGALQAAQEREIGEVPRPVSTTRCSTLNPLQARAGWGALFSDETIHESEAVARVDKRKRDSIGLPKKFRKGGIPLKKLKRLTAILESPRSKQEISPALPPPDTMPGYQKTAQHTPQKATGKAFNLQQIDADDVFVSADSPKPEVLPSFAIRSPGRYGAGIANNDNPRPSRSISVGAMHPTPHYPAHGNVVPSHQTHARSLSLGTFVAPITRPPSGPVPPLPVIAPHMTDTDKSTRQGMCVTRASSSSQDSASSSVLVTSPILDMSEQKSPSLDDIVAQDDSASLKTVSIRQWQSPLVSMSDQIPTNTIKQNIEGLNSHTSIRSNVARYSAESLVKQRLSAVSVASSDSIRRRLSIVQMGLADQVSISRVSSSNSLGSSVRKVTTPRKGSRSSVSANGSPLERKKGGVLRDLSINSLGPSRQPSNATQNSGRSSNGNPFQWDQPMQKPSALKGSPNARKGHKRQNCVRISTLTPQILGPPPSRPTSPSIMHGIEEESGDGDEAATQPGAKFVSNQRIARPPSGSYLAPNLRMQKLRASLTPSSPTLSAWNTYQEHGLPSQTSESQLSVSTTARTASRQSNRSSAYSIPPFPSPRRATVTPAQLSQPVPEVYLSRPSTDIDEDDISSPFPVHLSSSPPPLSSSSPALNSKHQMYDPAHPAWPTVTIPAPKDKDYDPASPAWNDTEPQRSSGSAFFPFATNSTHREEDEEVSPHSRPASYSGDLPDTPPLSPKTMPEGFQAFFDRKDSNAKPPMETLTSANASSIMARIPSKPDFPGAPILLPPPEPEFYTQIRPAGRTPRQRAASNAAYLIPSRRAPPPPMCSDGLDIPSPLSNEGCMPSPLHINTKIGPQGPRVQPAQSVLKNAMALRRMNSEANNISDRASRRYVRLGREASPLLPWIGSPDPSESYADINDMFDFGFAASAGAQEGEITPKLSSALDEVDMDEVERKLDGAIAGFDAMAVAHSPTERNSSSVWDLGHEYWQQNPHLSSTPVSGTAKGVTKEETDSLSNFNGFEEAQRSIQNTPKSLYDAEGFLRT